MSLINEIHKLERLHQLVRRQATGSPKELAGKMQISRRTVFRMIDTLKEIGCPVYFNKEKNSYCYHYPIKLTFLKIENNNPDNE